MLRVVFDFDKLKRVFYICFLYVSGFDVGGDVFGRFFFVFSCASCECCSRRKEKERKERKKERKRKKEKKKWRVGHHRFGGW